MQLVFASGNENKVREVRQILEDIPAFSSVAVLSLRDIGFTGDIVEDGQTFEENALIKARAIAALGYACFADDSGLEVDALGGAPGVYSARYCGIHGDDPANNALLLKNMSGIPTEKRTARYVAAIAYASPDGAEFTLRGTCEGKILTEEDGGRGGFGYDPLFFVEEYGKTFASVTAEEKHAISHRGKAVRAFAEEMIRRKLI